MWIETFTPLQVAEIHNRFHGHSALPADMVKIEALCEEVNMNSRCIDGTQANADAIQVAADYALKLKSSSWVDDINQSEETALIVAATYLRLSGFIVDCEDPMIFYLMQSTNNRHQFEQILYFALIRHPVKFSTPVHDAPPRERLPLTSLGINDYRGIARLRRCVDEAAQSCCFQQDGSTWDAHYAQLEMEKQQAAKLLLAQYQNRWT